MVAAAAKNKLPMQRLMVIHVIINTSGSYTPGLRNKTEISSFYYILYVYTSFILYVYP